MELKTVSIEKPADMNFILGQSHFIKTVEDLYEAIVQTVPQMKFGIGFCESSGPALVRFAGNDPKLIELAQKNASGSFLRPRLHHLHGRRIPHQYSEHREERPGSLPCLLRYREFRGGDRSGIRTGPWNLGGH